MMSIPLSTSRTRPVMENPAAASSSDTVEMPVGWPVAAKLSTSGAPASSSTTVNTFVPPVTRPLSSSTAIHAPWLLADHVTEYWPRSTFAAATPGRARFVA